jgi:hypothetical protein
MKKEGINNLFELVQNSLSTVNCLLSTILCGKSGFKHKILNFAVRLYYQLSYKHSAQYNMLLINALGIH